MQSRLGREPGSAPCGDFSTRLVFFLNLERTKLLHHTSIKIYQEYPRIMSRTPCRRVNFVLELFFRKIYEIHSAVYLPTTHLDHSHTPIRARSFAQTPRQGRKENKLMEGWNARLAEIPGETKNLLTLDLCPWMHLPRFSNSLWFLEGSLGLIANEAIKSCCLPSPTNPWPSDVPSHRERRHLAQSFWKRFHSHPELRQVANSSLGKDRLSFLWWLMSRQIGRFRL